MMYELHDDTLGQTVMFDGVQLGFSTTEESLDTHRWTEVTIYRTAAGAYVVCKAGLSRIVHAYGSNCSSTARTVDATYDDAIACVKCQPDLINDELFLEEVDRSYVHVSATPSGVIESLYSTDANGVTYMTTTARRALRQASAADADLSRASTTRVIA